MKRHNRLSMKMIPQVTLALFAGILFWPNASKAQQDPMYTHYMYNTLSVNPAYAGSRDALTITGITRHQWVGLEGAPTTQTITTHTPILSEKLGAGLSFVSDRIGPISTAIFSADLSYQVKVSEKANLSFGLKGGFSYRQGNLSNLQTTDALDPSFENNIQSDFLPNFGFGMYYSTERYYAGVSVPKLLQNNFSTGQAVVSSSDPAAEKRHYFLIGGAIFPISSALLFKPTTLVKVVENAPLEVDFTANFLIFEKVWLGAMYRSRDAVGALLGYQFTEQLKFGYSLDCATTRLISTQSGTHEVMLTYDFLFKTQGKIKSPRYF